MNDPISIEISPIANGVLVTCQGYGYCEDSIGGGSGQTFYLSLDHALADLSKTVLTAVEKNEQSKQAAIEEQRRYLSSQNQSQVRSPPGAFMRDTPVMTVGEAMGILPEEHDRMWGTTSDFSGDEA